MADTSIKIMNALRSKFGRKVSQYDLFVDEYERFKSIDKNKRFIVSEDELYPCLDDKTSLTPFDAHYIYHPAWAARVISKTMPAMHVDISSTLHFCTIISAFVKTAFYDFRPAGLTLSNLTSSHADLTRLHFESGSINSLSCMHTIEHIGLGRYGDPLDPDGDLKAFNELKRVCAIDADLLIVIPVGIRKLMFNAHRIYAPTDLLKYMDGFELKEFAFVNDDCQFLNDADMNDAATQKYGCGCYWLKKVS